MSQFPLSPAQQAATAYTPGGSNANTVTEASTPQDTSGTSAEKTGFFSKVDFTALGQIFGGVVNGAFNKNKPGVPPNEQQPTTGGFPWGWVLGGLALVGGVIALVVFLPKKAKKAK